MSGRNLKLGIRPFRTEETVEEDETCIGVGGSDSGSNGNIKRTATMNTMSFSGVSRRGGRSSRTNTM